MNNNDIDEYVNQVAAVAEDHDDDDDDCEECIVILFRSPGHGSLSGNLTASSVLGDGECDGDGRRHRGLTFLPDGPVHFPSPRGGGAGGGSNMRILHAFSGLIVAAAGFAPDADHMLSVAAGRVLSRLSVYDAPHPASRYGSRRGVDPHRLVRDDISPSMIDASMSDGGRPYGVQLLVVGPSALSSRRNANANAKDDRSLEIYTVDPSGGWRSWVGGGTALGRGAEGVRSYLLRRQMTRHPAVSMATEGTSRASSTTTTTSTSTTTNDRRGWRGALDSAMMSSLVAFADRDVDYSGIDDDADDIRGGGGEDGDRAANYGAVVIFGPPSLASRRGRIRPCGSRCAMVGSVDTEESYDRCRARLCAERREARQVTRDRRNLERACMER